MSMGKILSWLDGSVFCDRAAIGTLGVSSDAIGTIPMLA